MESIGRLAGGVAHDFNNMLTAITGYAQMLAMNLKDDEHSLKRIEGITEATERAASLTMQLLAFSRKQVLKPRIMNLNETTSGLKEMLSRTVGVQYDIVLDLDKNLPSIEADRSQVEQVLMNLVINAADAMPKGGTITIKTETTTGADLPHPHERRARAGSFVHLMVRDEGTGMDKETISQVFEPFFTTKPRGKGTGLGLSTVYGIVNQSNGVITVDSEPGAGSTFSVFLPACDASSGRAPSSIMSRNGNNLLKGTGTVLVAEDEDMIREYVCEILQQCGYSVLCAENGANAVELARGSERPIDLVVSDVMMPKMTGPEAVDEILSFSPATGVVFISGYTQDGVFSSTMKRSNAVFLQKPFSPQDLSKTVFEKLSAKHAA